jgi:cytochrome c-type biogenesis protein CcmE
MMDANIMTRITASNSERNWDDDSLDHIDDELDFGYESATSTQEGTNWGVMIGLLIAVAAVSYIVFDGLKSQTYFYAVDEAVARGDDLIGQTIRIRGVVETGTIVGEPGGLNFSFRLAEQGQSMAVAYTKALPDTFAEGTEVVAQGRVDASLTMHADEVLVKCPSRYEGAPPTSGEVAGPQAAR